MYPTVLTTHHSGNCPPAASRASSMVLGALLVTLVLFGVVCSSASPRRPIKSPELAASTIDRLADAIDRGDEQAALSLVAHKHSPEAVNTLRFLIKNHEMQYSAMLRTRRYTGSTPSYYMFEVTVPGTGLVDTIRVYQRNPDDGIYEDEGVEIR